MKKKRGEWKGHKGDTLRSPCLCFTLILFNVRYRLISSVRMIVSRSYSFTDYTRHRPPGVLLRIALSKYGRRETWGAESSPKEELGQWVSEVYLARFRKRCRGSESDGKIQQLALTPARRPCWTLTGAYWGAQQGAQPAARQWSLEQQQTDVSVGACRTGESSVIGLLSFLDPGQREIFYPVDRS